MDCLLFYGWYLFWVYWSYYLVLCVLKVAWKPIPIHALFFDIIIIDCSYKTANASSNLHALDFNSSCPHLACRHNSRSLNNSDLYHLMLPSNEFICGPTPSNCATSTNKHSSRALAVDDSSNFSSIFVQFSKISNVFIKCCSQWLYWSINKSFAAAHHINAHQMHCLLAYPHSTQTPISQPWHYSILHICIDLPPWSFLSISVPFLCFCWCRERDSIIVTHE